ncbi:hypothetical protein PsorP6_018058 [Peronosclerospora sorghi]|uniref:Uncharacterized protein n=1 Tax=Peronosclerospora sorghi TaxID=230839 RepID=A0ACC0WEN7_9STRA|nr:hypothetical protein PsorP6_018058 [Peronosclerospora sorghi]
MAFAECLDAWDDCFSFFNGKSPYHTTRRTRLSHFTRNQRVAWKLLGALSMLVTIPYSGTSLPGLCAFGNLAHLVIVSVDFYFTAPLFKANHVFLVLLWPVLWILIQFLWVVSGHEPSNDLFNFHSLSSPLATLVLLVGTAAIFYVLHWYSRYLHRVSGKGPKAAVNTGEDAEERSSTFTPTVPFELVVDTSVETRLHA